jgi:hypothetical protein
MFDSGGDDMTEKEGERIARLEAQQEHMEAKIDAMASQVKEMHDLLMQARGARWVLLGAAAITGFAASKLGTVSAYLIQSK